MRIIDFGTNMPIGGRPHARDVRVPLSLEETDLERKTR